MPQRSRKTSIYFGEFRLEIVENYPRPAWNLFRGNNVRPELEIQVRSLEVLECILRSAPGVIARNDIADKLWEDQPDEGGNLDHHLSAIRKALNDDHARPRLIRTLRGRGLQMMVPVVIKSSDAKDTAPPQAAVFSDEDVQAFEEFFGQGTAHPQAKSARGVIVVQADHLERLTVALDVNVNAGIKRKPGNRSFKARTWVNYNDLLGAQAIVKLFDAHQLRTPHISMSLKNVHEDANLLAEAAFVAAFGLGFTDRTTRALKLCHPWMRVSRASEAGDAIAIHEKLLLRYCSPDAAARRGFVRAPDEEGFWLRLPQGWNDTYLDSWQALLDIDNTVEPVEDYAIILRYTRMTGSHRQILFVLAGFTERGTAIAGRYLALNWRQLWRNYVHKQPYEGDFVILIEGPSDVAQARRWQEDDRFTITPKVIHDLGITGEGWFDRVDKATALRKP